MHPGTEYIRERRLQDFLSIEFYIGKEGDRQKYGYQYCYEEKA